MHHSLSFIGGSDRQDGVPHKRNSLYLPAGVSGLHLRQNLERKGGNEKTDSSVRGRTGGEQQVKEREAARISAEVMRARRKIWHKEETA